MKLINVATTVALLASSAHGQKALEWNEPTSGVTYGLAVPEAASAPFDVLLSIVAPAKAGWVGWAAGGCMLRSPILVAWPNGNTTVVSSRWANAYHPPAPYNGTSTKVFASSSTRNETHWKVSVLCSGCSQWVGGEVNSHGNATFGWGVSSHAVDTPASASSAIRFHDVGKGHFELDMNKARLSKDDFGALVKSLGG